MFIFKFLIPRDSVLRRLGRVLHVSPSRNAIIKVENPPEIGEAVVDENLKPVGKVIDIFGSTSSPYVAVRTMVEPKKLIDKMLYTLPVKRGKRKM